MRRNGHHAAKGPPNNTKDIVTVIMSPTSGTTIQTVY